MNGRGRPRKDEGKRANGDGSVYFDKTRGKWVAAITLDGITASGRPRYKTTTHPSEAAAHKALKKMRDVQLGGDSLAAPATVAKIAADYLAHIAKSDTGMKRATYAIRRVRIQTHLIDDARIGRARVDRLTATEIESWLRAKVAEGYMTRGSRTSPPRHKPYAKSTIAIMKSDLRKVLNWAIGRGEYGLANVNMAKVADLPANLPKATPKRTLTRDQATQLIKECRGSERRYTALVLMMLTMGVRPGEAAGLLWTDIEEDGTINFRGAIKREHGKAVGLGTTKTGTTRRLRAPAVVLEALSRERAMQDRLRAACPTPWPTQWGGLVFLGSLGEPPRSENLRRSTRLIMADAGLDIDGLDDITPYEMRHSCVSLASDGGASDFDLIDQFGWTTGRMIHNYRHKVDPIAGEGSAAMFDSMSD